MADEVTKVSDTEVKIVQQIPKEQTVSLRSLKASLQLEKDRLQIIKNQAARQVFLKQKLIDSIKAQIDAAIALGVKDS